MAVFTKGAKPTRAPRCDVATAKGRCTFRGARYVTNEQGVSVFCCSRHAAVIEKKGSAK